MVCRSRVGWKKAHTRASARESAHEKELRRGNAVADAVANEGRKLHVNVNDKVGKVKHLEKVAKTWANWVGAAADLQCDTEFDGCDHTLPTKRCIPRKKGRAVKEPQLPVEGRVLRRFPWAANSLGTTEYVGDLHAQESESHRDSVSIDRVAEARGRQQERPFQGGKDAEIWLWVPNPGGCLGGQKL